MLITGAEVLSFLACGLTGLGAIEAFLHRRNLSKVPVRIHVSGTRGKSSVARLIATGLSMSGLPTTGKTTGTLARMIMPDQSEYPVYRPLGANIIEQKRIIATTAKMGVKNIVIECMALQPIFHWISEKHLVRATHGVITNIREDHLDVMGPTEHDVALAIASMVPVKGTLYTAEVRNLDVLKMACDDRKTKLVAVGPEDVAAVTDEEMSGFKYSEHKENVALVLRILADFGISRENAVKAIWHTNPDPGALADYKLDYFGRKIIFVNAFAANDPESTARVWNSMLKRYPNVDKEIALFNMRADRPSRTQQLSKESTFWRDADKVILIGTGAYLFASLATKDGVDPELFSTSEGDNVADIFENILENCSGTTIVIGMGNIGGPGLGLVRYFRNRSIKEVF